MEVSLVKGLFRGSGTMQLLGALNGLPKVMQPPQGQSYQIAEQPSGDHMWFEPNSL
jgi:hypothetical protein